MKCRFRDKTAKGYKIATLAQVQGPFEWWVLQWHSGQADEVLLDYTACSNTNAPLTYLQQ